MNHDLGFKLNGEQVVLGGSLFNTSFLIQPTLDRIFNCNWNATGFRLQDSPSLNGPVFICWECWDLFYFILFYFILFFIISFTDLQCRFVINIFGHFMLLFCQFLIPHSSSFDICLLPFASISNADFQNIFGAWYHKSILFLFLVILPFFSP